MGCTEHLLPHLLETRTSVLDSSALQFRLLVLRKNLASGGKKGNIYGVELGAGGLQVQLHA